MANRLSQLLNLLKDNENDSFLRFAVAKEHEKHGQLHDALHYYQKIVENDPGYVGVYYHLGKLYEALGQGSRAVETYKAGIEQATGKGDLHAKAELSSALMELEM